MGRMLRDRGTRIRFFGGRLFHPLHLSVGVGGLSGVCAISPYVFALVFTSPALGPFEDSSRTSSFPLRTRTFHAQWWPTPTSMSIVLHPESVGADWQGRKPFLIKSAGAVAQLVDISDLMSHPITTFDNCQDVAFARWLEAASGKDDCEGESPSRRHYWDTPPQNHSRETHLRLFVTFDCYYTDVYPYSL
jgi:hypothetical protein